MTGGACERSCEPDEGRALWSWSKRPCSVGLTKFLETSCRTRAGDKGISERSKVSGTPPRPRRDSNASCDHAGVLGQETAPLPCCATTTGRDAAGRDDAARLSPGGRAQKPDGAGRLSFSCVTAIHQKSGPPPSSSDSSGRSHVTARTPFPPPAATFLRHSFSLCPVFPQKLHFPANAPNVVPLQGAGRPSEPEPPAALRGQSRA